MNYQQAMNFLNSAMRFGSRLGLERMRGIMDELGRPGVGIPCIHVAGTNGKGSTSVMIASMYAAAGYKVGLYTSPFLERFSERIRVIDGMTGLLQWNVDETSGEIPDHELLRCVRKIKPATQRVLAKGIEHPTEFELVTAAAFLYFQSEHCDMLVLETGLGGALDSTNIIDSPVKCVITPIGYDHMDRLGNTIREIASQKAGIIKPGAQVYSVDPVSYAHGDDAAVIREVLEDAAARQHVKLIRWVDPDSIEVKAADLNGQTLLYHPDRSNALSVRIPLLGAHQPMNAALAILSCIDSIDTKDIVFGMARAKWPGRMEIIRKENPCILLDGAHNEQGAAALAESIARIFANRRFVFLIGVMRDKEYRKMLGSVLCDSRYTTEAVVCTRPDNDRALAAAELAAIAKEILDKKNENSYNQKPEIYFTEDVVFAVQRAVTAALESGAVVVAFGSLYMAGVIRSHVRAGMKQIT